MKIYQVDAFTKEKFRGNPAAVCILPDGFDAEESWMQNIAAEMNLSETAFVQKHVKSGGVYLLRWFTPSTEVDLCGHATLAAAHILWQEELLPKDEPALFDTRSGRLDVTLDTKQMTMNFPVDEITPSKEPVGLEMALGCPVIATFNGGQDLLVEVKDEQTVLDITPSYQQLSVLAVRCIVVTAQGNNSDFVSRTFCPACGIDEDPVTGSTHCSLTPFWANRLGKTKMEAKQISERGGILSVELLADRVHISGQAITVFKAELL